MTRPLRFTTRRAERGNVFAMLFGAVALTGVLAAVSMQTLTGPVTTITRVTQRNVAENNLLMNGKILINAAVAGVSGGDADADGIIEPAPFIAPGGGEAAPGNGGFLPTDLGLALTDPWGTKYGYCVWDHGTTNTSANRITGDDTASASTQPVIAIIAAGPDKTFQTSCPAWSGGPVTVSKASGSDDLIEHYTYAEATASSNGLWSLNASDQAKAELRDSGGTARVTIDRSTGIGDFLGITTDTLAARSSVLTLDGGLRLDTDSNVTACAAGDAGVIRFNTTSGKLEVCNGTAWKAAGSDLWLENGTHIYSGNTGNVGIGTTTPTQKLDVAGNAAVSGNSTIGGTLGVTGATTLGDTLSVTGAATLSSTLAVTGATTLSSTLDVTGNTTIDSGTLFVDAATNRVGIGTTSPALPLTVANGAKTTATSLLARLGTADASNPLALDIKAMGGATSADRGIVLVPTEVGLGANFLRVGDTNLPYFQVNGNGNVGIGTATPFYLLDVNGTARIAGAATLSNTLSVAGSTAIDTDTLFVDAAADTIGIGTTTPAAKLDVVGGIKVGADAVCNAAKAGMVAWNANQFQVCDGTAFRNVSAIEKLDDIGDVYVSEAGTPNNNDILAWNSTDNRWEAKNVNTVGSAVADPGGLDKQVQFNDGGTLAGAAQLYWDKASNRLGIGTATPEGALHANGNLIVDGAITSRRGGAISNVRMISGNYGAILRNDGTHTLLLLTDSGDTMGSWNTLRPLTVVNASGEVRIGSSLYVVHAGNVGIGTTTPQSNLHVAGGIQLGDDTATCPGASNVKLGTLRFNSGGLQVCVSGGWSNVGADTLSGLSCATNEIPKWNGSAWACAADSGGSPGQEVSFHVHKNGANQTVTSGTPTLLTWSTEVIDTNDNFASNRFTPTVAGYYYFDVTMYCSEPATARCAVDLRKNGMSVYSSTETVDQTGREIVRSGGIIALNGTTDYVEAWATLTTGTTVYGDSRLTHFSGFLIGGGGGGGTTLPNCADGETIVRQGGAWVCSDMPDVFAFTDLTGQATNTLVSSNILPVTGALQATVTISGTGSPQYRICADASCASVIRNWTNAASTINQGQHLQLRLTTAATTDGATRTATVQIGQISDAWSVSTQDDTPNAFSFTDVTGQPASTVITSNTLTITGIGPNPTNVSVSGAGSPQISINGGAWTTSGTMLPGQTLAVRLTSAGTSSTMRSATVTLGNSTDQWDVTTVGQDNTPNAFNFVDVANQPANTVVSSSTLTITGIGPDPVNVSITGAGSPQISINGGAWGTSGTILNGQTLQLRLTSHTVTDGTPRSATVTVGTGSDTWSVVTQDDTPAAFSFTDVSNQAVNTVITSNTLTITGIGGNPTAVSVTGTGSPQISINGGAWTTSGTILAGQTLAVRLTSAGTSSTTRSATVTVGNSSDTWSVTTIPQDDTPVAFDFTDLTNQLFSTLVTSNVVTITGIGPDPVNVSISGGGTPQFSIAGGAWVTSGTITNGQTLQLRMTTASSSTTTLTATVTVGTVSDAWATTTQVQDNTPNAFAFTDVTGQQLAAVITSNTLTITGIGPAPVSVSVTGAGSPQVSINGGAWTTSGSISNGQTLAVRLTSAGTSNTARTATVTVGTVSDTWSVTTATVTSGSQSYTTAGTYTFTVPHHETLTVEVWGAGGGGAGCSVATEVQGGNGGDSSWDGAVLANGGARASTSAGGAGGTASGGTTNQTGGTGGTSSSNGAAGGSGASGGSGGALRTSSGNGNGGSAPGGGGGGARSSSRGGTCSGDGGGGGGYSTRAYSAGTYVQGSGVTVTVGAGGSKGNGSSYDGGAGAVGRVTITWN